MILYVTTASKLKILFFYCLFKKILLEIGFVQEIRTTSDNKEVPQAFFSIQTPLIRENTRGASRVKLAQGAALKRNGTSLS